MKASYLLIVVMSFSGCASVLNKTTKPISITSDAEDAQIYIDGQYSGRTPAKIELDTRKPYVVTLKKAGFEDGTKRLNPQVGGGWVLADIVLTGFLGALIDAVTGDWSSFDDKAHIAMRPAPERSTAATK